MGWINKAKKAASQAKSKLAEIDTEALKERAREGSSAATARVSEGVAQARERISEIDTEALKERAREGSSAAAARVSEGAAQARERISEIDTEALRERAREGAITLSMQSKAYASETYAKAQQAIDNIDWERVADSERYKESIILYWQASKQKISEMARSTLEVDKNTLDMVNDLQSRLPIPAKTVDDIFTQCRDAALQRALAAFFLGGMAESIDNASAEKYEKLSVDYKEYSSQNNVRSHENYDDMRRQRAEAGLFGRVEDGYNIDSITYGADVDVEHIVSANSIYNSIVLRAGTTDEQLLDAINDEDNLIFTNSSVNRSKGADSVDDFISKHEPHPTKEGVIVITTRNGEVHEINKADAEAADAKARAALREHTVSAAKEIGVTAAKTGAVMAMQQVVGMMIVETIDIFMDETERFVDEFKLFDEKGVAGNAQELSERLSTRLSERFEEKQIWAKARALGLESGVSGALSVIPQILISTITKLPAFVLGMIREGTLSCVRSARVLASSNPNKLQSISIIMAATASAVAGLYVARVVSTGISAVPMLNFFNRQVTAVLTELAVMAIPLIAIYTFDKNKKRLVFALTKNRTTEELAT